AAAESSVAVKSAELFVDSFDQAPRDLRLVPLRPVLDAIGGDQVHPVAMATHHVSGHIVGDDPVGALGLALCDCLLDHALSLGGEADQEPRTQRACTELAENVARGNEVKLGRTVAL